MAIHFTKEEFLIRKSKVVKELKKQNLDGLLMFRQESMYWLTGYDTFGYVYFQCLVLTANGDLILLTRTPDLRQAQNTSIIEDIRIWVDKDKSKPVDQLMNILSELSLEKSNLGVEYEAYGLTGTNAMRLNDSLKNFATLHDKSELISFLRVVKSPAEIVYEKKLLSLQIKLWKLRGNMHILVKMNLKFWQKCKGLFLMEVVIILQTNLLLDLERMLYFVVTKVKNVT